MGKLDINKKPRVKSVVFDRKSSTFLTLNRGHDRHSANGLIRIDPVC